MHEGHTGDYWPKVMQWGLNTNNQEPISPGEILESMVSKEFIFIMAWNKKSVENGTYEKIMNKKE